MNFQVFIPWTAALLATTLLPVVGSGCRPLPTRQGLLEQTNPGAQVSSRGLRVMVVEFVPNYAHKIEATADAILAQSDDPVIRQNALLWKINAISSGFGAASRPDALAAFLDLRVLVRQMSLMFESPTEPTLFGPWQPQAILACQQLEAQLQDIHTKLGTNVEIGHKFVERTALANPLQDLYFQRAPIVTQNLDKIEEPNREMLEVVTSLQDDLSDLQRISALYAEFIPKQARWQAELLALTAHQTPVVRTSLEQLGLASQAMSQIALTAESLEFTLDRELQELPGLLDRQREETLAEVDRLRSDTLQALQAEREIVLASLHQEQEAVGVWVRHTARESTEQADAIVQHGVAESEAVATRILDRLVIYGSALLGLAGILALLMLIWLKLGARRTQLTQESSQTLRVFEDETSGPWDRRAA